MVLELKIGVSLSAAITARQAMRRFVEGDDPILAADDDRRADLLLLVSELVTNSVRHAGLGADDRIALRASVEAGVLRIEVSDRGPGFRWTYTGRPPPGRSGGRGVWLVAELSDRWGIRDGPTTVWFEFDL